MKSIRSNHQTNSHLAKRWKVKEEKSYSCRSRWPCHNRLHKEFQVDLFWPKSKKDWGISQTPYSPGCMRNFFYLVYVISVDPALSLEIVSSREKKFTVCYSLFSYPCRPCSLTYNFYLKWIKCKYTFTAETLNSYHTASTFWILICWLLHITYTQNVLSADKLFGVQLNASYATQRTEGTMSIRMVHPTH